MSEVNKRAVELFDITIPAKPAELAESVIEAIKGGEVEPLPIHIVMKRFQKAIEIYLADKDVADIIRNNAEDYLGGKKTAEVFGAKVQVGAVHTSYNFKDCGHPAWNAWNEILKTAKAQLSVIEKELKELALEAEKKYTNQQSFGIPNTSTTVTIPHLPRVEYDPSGEVVTINPPIKFQKMGTKITL